MVTELLCLRAYNKSSGTPSVPNSTHLLQITSNVCLNQGPGAGGPGSINRKRENAEILIDMLTILDNYRNRQLPSLEINAKTLKKTNPKADLTELLPLAHGLKFPLGHQSGICNIIQNASPCSRSVSAY
jgi:hypothetical protein